MRYNPKELVQSSLKSPVPDWLRRKAGIALAGLIAATCLGGWQFYERWACAQALQDTSRFLTAVNQTRMQEVAEWRAGLEREGRRLSRHPFLGDVVAEEISKPGLRKEQLKQWMHDHDAAKGYRAMAFLTPAGSIIAASDAYQPAEKKGFDKIFAQALSGKEARITDFYLSAAGKPSMAVLAPVFVGGGKARRLQCVLAIVVDPLFQLSEVLKATALFLPTAETLLARKDGDRAQFLSELKFRQDAALKFSIPLSSDEAPAVRGLKGFSGAMEGVDYRGVRVCAAVTRVLGSDWVVVTKIDRESVLAGARLRARFICAAGAMGLLVALLLWYLLLLLRARREFERISELELNWHALWEHSAEGVALHKLVRDENGRVVNYRILKINPSYETILELKATNVTGKLATEIYGTREAPYLEEFGGVALSGRPHHMDVYFAPMGKYFAISIAPLGRDGFVTIFSDITQRKRREEELRLKELIFQSTTVAISAADKAGIIRQANPMFLTVWGFKTIEEVIGKPISSFMTSAEQAAAIVSALDKTGHWAGDFTGIKADGTLFTARASASIIIDELGKHIGYQSSVQDVTEQLHAAALLAKEKALADYLIDQNPYAVQVLDGRGHHLKANKKFLRVFGSFPPPEWDFFEDPVFAKAGLQGENLKLKDGKVVRLDEVWYNTNWLDPRLPDQLSCLSSVAFPIMDAAGVPERFVIMFDDITAKKTAEREKERLMAELSEKHKELENFLHISAHDLRSPLINVTGFAGNLERDVETLASLLKRSAPVDDEGRLALKLAAEAIPESLDFIRNGVRTMETLLAALLKVSRIGRLIVSCVAVDMDASLGAVVNSLRWQLDKAGALIKVEPLPLCRADHGAVSQIFTNLLQNSVNYRAEGRRLEITVRGEKTAANTVIYTVSDNGRGINEEDFSKIFEILFRGSNVGVEKGEGIGLSIVRRLTVQVGGKVWAASKEGTGSAFSVELPA